MLKQILKHMNYYKYFTNNLCEYYPCHNIDNINCMFCYCPLYFIDCDCGNYTICGNGVKDCSDCVIPHDENSWEYITNQLKLHNINL